MGLEDQGLLDLANLSEVPFTIYQTLDEKLGALLDGEILLIKGFEQRYDNDVLIRLDKQKFTVTQISYDKEELEMQARYWITFNIGINDLSLFTVYKYEEGVFNHTNKFKLNDVVLYRSIDGRTDKAIIEKVYVSNLDHKQYAYSLSRDDGLYVEEDLVVHKYI